MTEQNKKAVSVEINGKAYGASAGQTIIQVADKHGVYIPRFCYHEKLSVVANCRMCLVEVANAPKPMPACATPVANGMQVMTSSKKAVDAQRAVMAFLLVNHPLDCPVCDQGGSCELQDLSMGFGRGTSEFTLPKRAVADKDIGPLVKTHMTRCIHCTRCVRFGEEIAGMRELGATGRGEHMEIGTYVSKMMRSELSGNAIDICPVGALTSKPFAFSARHWELKQHPSVSPHDAVGSHLYLHTRGDAYHPGRRVMKVIPRFAPDTNENWLSDRDRFSYEGLHSPDRLLAPEIKIAGKWQTVPWQEALDHASDALMKIIAAHGPEQLAGLASSQCTTESFYSFQTWLRGLGCAHLDFRGLQRDFSDDEYAAAMPANDTGLAVIEQSDVVFLVGSCVRQEQPMLNHRIRKAVLRGAKVISLHTMPYDANYDLSHELVVDMDHMVAALAYWAVHCLGEHAPAEWSVYAEKTVSQAMLKDMAVLWQQAKRGLVVLGSDACHHPHAALIRQILAFMVQHQGCNVLTLSVGPNAAGACMAGMLPHCDAGGQAVSHPGEHAMAMMQSPKKAYVLLNHEPEWDHARPDIALAALKQAEIVLCCTPFATDTMREYATVLLPIAPFAFEDGSYVNMMGAVQSMQALPSEQLEVRQAWQVFQSLAGLMSVSGLSFTEAKQMTDQLQAQPMNEPVARTSWQWPALPTAAERQQGKYRCILRTHMYQIDPLVRRSKPLQVVAQSEVLTAYLHPEAIANLGLSTGDSVVVHSGDQCLTMAYAACDQIPTDGILLYRQDATQCALVQGAWLRVERGQ